MAILCSLEKKGYHAWLAPRPHDLCTLRMKYCVVLDSFQSNNASWKSMKEILQTKFTMKSEDQKVSRTKLASLVLEA
jgi:hypothetical protein